MLRQQVRINQEHANQRSQRQYGKQRRVTTYQIGDKVSIAVPALDRAPTDDKRIFGKVIGVREEYDSYQILTKYGVLDRQYPISELNCNRAGSSMPIIHPPNFDDLRRLALCSDRSNAAASVPTGFTMRIVFEYSNSAIVG